MSSSLFFDREVTFSSLPIDRRLFKAVARQRLIHPTLIQSKVLPLALQGKDLIISSRTGSGKTLAYLLPLLHSLLHTTEPTPPTPPPPPATRAVILVPTRELAHQVLSTLTTLTFYTPHLSALAITADAKPSTQLPLLARRPSVLIATPGRLLEHMEGGAVDPSAVDMLVLDEADLLLTFDFAPDVRAIHALLPRTHQTLLLSATLPPELAPLTSLLDHPTTLSLSASSTPSPLTQHYIVTPSQDKVLLLYALLRLQLLPGKLLLFTNSVDAAFRLKLTLEQFSVSSAVINEGLPYTARMSVLQQFNRGMFDYLIATDRSVKEVVEAQGDQAVKGAGPAAVVKVEEDEVEEVAEDDDGDVKVKDEKQSGEPSTAANPIDVDTDADVDADEPVLKSAGEEEDGEAAVAVGAKKERSGRRGGRKAGRGVKREFDLSRGIDFVDVAAVINVDFPLTISSYIHRVGRTARAGKAGMALSLVTPAERSLLDALLAHQTAELASATLDPSPPLTPLSFDPSAIEAFRYRVEDVSRAVTVARVHSARLAEQRQALLSSVRLKGYYEDHPRELGVLRADRGVKGARVQEHLARVPDYLVPQGMSAEQMGGGRRVRMGRGASAGAKAAGKGAGKKRSRPPGKKRSDDPLRSAGNGRSDAAEGGAKRRRKVQAEI